MFLRSLAEGLEANRKELGELLLQVYYFKNQNMQWDKAALDVSAHLKSITISGLS